LFPCLHAATVIKRTGASFFQFVDETYHLSTLLKCYATHITPVNTDDFLPDGVVLPPFVTTQVGSQKKKRIRTIGE
jgi:hypothetical protein